MLFHYNTFYHLPTYVIVFCIILLYFGILKFIPYTLTYLNIYSIFFSYVLHWVPGPGPRMEENMTRVFNRYEDMNNKAFTKTFTPALSQPHPQPCPQSQCRLQNGNTYICVYIYIHTYIYIYIHIWICRAGIDIVSTIRG